MKFSDLDLDIPSTKSDIIKNRLVRASVKNDQGIYQPHPAGVYFYKSIPQYNNIAILDYKEMETKQYQKIDILNNTFLDNIPNNKLDQYLDLIETENIDWIKLWEYDKPYQLTKYPLILKEFSVKSVMDLAIVLAIIRPGAVRNFNKMKKFIHTTKIYDKISDKNEKEILKDTYGIPVFDEQFKALGILDGQYRYKKPHSIGYAYVLLIDFLKKNV